MTEPSHDPHQATPSGKARARSLGISFGGRPGRWNAITDVPGVEVGYETLIEGDSVRTGVTAIHPRGRGNPGDPCAAGYHSQNGNGETTGVFWINESGTMSGPICITNTHAVGVAHGSIVRWTATHHREFAEAWLVPIAAETWDGYLNDINGGHVTEAVGVRALEAALSGPIEEGSVGGGTGMNCYEFKGGSGTASRLVEYGGRDYVVGVCLQANFGARSELTIAGVPLGAALADDNPLAVVGFAPPGAGSCIAIVITDAPPGASPWDSPALAPRGPTSPGISSSRSPSGTRAPSRRASAPCSAMAAGPLTRSTSSHGASSIHSSPLSCKPPKRRSSTSLLRTSPWLASEVIGRPRSRAIVWSRC